MKRNSAQAEACATKGRLNLFAASGNRIVLTSALCAWAFFATSCVQPLGPGFLFSARQVEIRAATDSPEQLHIRVTDQFDNVGNLPLRSMEVRLPEGQNFGAQNLRVNFDNKDISPESTPHLEPGMKRANFETAWERQQPREIVTEWDLLPGPSARGTVAASATAFYIADPTAFPLWQSPSGAFTKGGPVPEQATLTVAVPSGFRVLAPGKPVKSRNSSNGNLESQTFQINPDEDFPPFVIAGRYEERLIATRHGALSFWTLGPLDAKQAQAAAVRLASSRQALTEFFGAASKGKTVMHIVESPSELPNALAGLQSSEAGVENESGAAAFPDGVLLDSRAFKQGLTDESVLQLAEYELARTWFGWRVQPRAHAEILMGPGIGFFSLVIAAEARGQNERGRFIETLLDRYDGVQRLAADRRILGPPSEYSLEERTSTGYKAALFFVALEDLCGHDKMRASLRLIVQARANADVGSEELRAAIEFTSGRDLAEMFRIWLLRPGIPEDFRSRYGKAPAFN